MESQVGHIHTKLTLVFCTSALFDDIIKRYFQLFLALVASHTHPHGVPFSGVSVSHAELLARLQSDWFCGAV